MMKKDLVVKFGSSCLVNHDGLDQLKIDGYAKKLAKLQDAYNLTLISSGAVAAGKRLLSEMGEDYEEFELETIACLGSAAASLAWQIAFKKLGLLTGQILVTHREIEDLKEGPILLRAIRKNIKSNVISVINENDVLSQSELKKLTYGGDNDGLAAHVAINLDAHALLLLTDVDGLIVEGKRKREVKLSEIESLQENLGKANGEGTGSMKTKLEAATSAQNNNVAAFIGNANADYKSILDGKTGTEVKL